MANTQDYDLGSSRELYDLGVDETELNDIRAELSEESR